MTFPNNPNFLLTDRRDSDFWKMSKILDEFYQRDFSSIVDTMRGLFPRSWQDRLQADVPVVESACKAVAVQYRQAPARRYFTPDGQSLSPNQAAALGRLYNALDVNKLFKIASEKLVVQRTIVGVIIPKPGTNRSVVLTFCPFECEVDPHPIMNEDPQEALEYRFRVPLKADYKQIEYGLLRMNKAGAFYEFQGKKTGVYQEDGGYPKEFEGRFPVFCFRLGEPPKGSFFCSLASDVMEAQQVVSIAASDALHASRYASWGQRVLTNADRNQVDTLQMGPETIIGLDDEQELKVVNGQANVKQYLEVIEHHLKYVSLHNHLHPSVFVSGNLTGLSKQMDLYDRQSIRSDMIQSLEGGEQSFYNALRLVLNAGVRADSWPAARVEVQFQLEEMPQNVLQEAQARILDFKAGISSPFEYVARVRGISLEEARELVEANAQEFKRLEAAGMVGE
jgi:hypothetical protein